MTVNNRTERDVQVIDARLRLGIMLNKHEEAGRKYTG
jgi:hypothetical protein